MVWEKSEAKEYEEHVERALKRKYPKTQWKIEAQSPIVIKGTKSKVDFRLTNRKTGKEVLVDAKSGRISVSDIRQMEDYKGASNVKEVIIYTGTRLTEIPAGIRQRAKKSGIKIVCSSTHSDW